jgi:hypothetical protein
MTKKYLSFVFSLAVLSCSAQFIHNTGIDIKSNGLIITNGDWANDAGIIQNNGVIQTSESFVNNGTLSPLSTGGFTLLFSTDLNFKPGGTQFGYIVKNGTGAALTTGTLSLKDSLVLKQGSIKLLTASDTVSLKSTARLTSSPTTWVEGLVSRTGTGTLDFPVGRDGMSLPLRLYKTNAQKITASVSTAPSGYVAGPGVDALISFPYVWTVKEKVTSDTAAYVELNYPTTLPLSANPVVAKQVTGNKYASRGARKITNTGGRISVISYSRGLVGTFTIATGFPADLATDSLAMVALYNATGGTGWTTRTNWLAGEIETWSGVTVDGQSLTAVNLANNKLSGAVPDQLVDIVALQTLNLSGNTLTSIPDFTANAQITLLNVSGNKLTFASLEPNAAVPGLNYTGQADLGTAASDLIPAGDPVELSVNAGGASSVYTWKRNGSIVPGATSPILNLTAINRSNMGSYVAEVINPKLPALTLKSATQTKLAYATIGGKLFAEPSVAAAKGAMTLLKVKPLAFDTIAKVNVASNGSYFFDKVVLDDYEIVGFADTLTYNRALPTYYKNTIFWEEADTIFLANNLVNIDITSSLEPSASSGRGVISGYLEEDDGSGRLSEEQRAKRVAGAGASVRRVEQVGRGQEEKLTLVAYVYTDENGEFTLPNLPTGEYRLNLQYPGYPMDPNSFITIPIGSGLQSQVNVQANVVNTKIIVKKLIITGILEHEQYSVNLFPNPAVEFVKVQFKNESASRKITLFDERGKVISSHTADNVETTMNVSELAKGFYIIRIAEKNVPTRSFKLSIE